MGRRQRNRDRQPRTDLTTDLVDLTEAAFQSSGDALICIATPGWGSTGYYPADVLERDAATAFPAGTHMYLDHPTMTERSDRPERSLRDLVGTLTEAGRWNPDGPQGAGVYAQATIHTHRDLIEALAPHIGVSLRAPGMSQQGEAEGKRGPIVQSLGKAHSVDFVTKAGRGGQIAQLYEAAGLNLDLEESAGSWFESQIHTDFTIAADRMYGDDRLTRTERIALSNAIGAALDAFTTAVTANAPQLYDRSQWDEPAADGEPDGDPDDDGPDPITPITPHLEESTMPISDQERQELTESITASVTAAITPLLEAAAPTPDPAVDELRESLRARDARDFVTSRVSRLAALPQTTRHRVIDQVTAQPVPLTEAGQVDEAALVTAIEAQVRAEVDYLVENGLAAPAVEGLGADSTPVEHDEAAIDLELAETFKGFGLSDSAATAALRGL